MIQQQLSDNEKSLIGNTVYDLDKYDNANYRDPKDKRPYRAITNWQLLRNKKNRQLPLTLHEITGSLTLVGELFPSNDTQQQQTPFELCCKKLLCWSFDKCPLQRGFWISTKHAFYWLQEPAENQVEHHIRHRALCGTLSNIIDLLSGENGGCIESNIGELYRDMNPVGLYRKFKEAADNNPSMNVPGGEPFNLEFFRLAKERGFMKREMRNFESDTGWTKSNFFKTFSEVNNKKVDDKDELQRLYVQSAEEAEARSKRYPWGGLKEDTNWVNPYHEWNKFVINHVMDKENNDSSDDDILSLLSLGEASVGGEPLQENSEVDCDGDSSDGDESGESDEEWTMDSGKMSVPKYRSSQNKNKTKKHHRSKGQNGHIDKKRKSVSFDPSIIVKEGSQSSERKGRDKYYFNNNFNNQSTDNHCQNNNYGRINHSSSSYQNHNIITPPSSFDSSRSMSINKNNDTDYSRSNNDRILGNSFVSISDNCASNNDKNNNNNELNENGEIPIPAFRGLSSFTEEDEENSDNDIDNSSDGKEDEHVSLLTSNNDKNNNNNELNENGEIPIPAFRGLSSFTEEDEESSDNDNDNSSDGKEDDNDSLLTQ